MNGTAREYLPLHVFCGGQPVTDFEVRPARPHSSLLIYDPRDGSPLRDGVWSARDRAAHELVVFHRGFLPSAPVTVPASDGGRDQAIIVELVRGTMIRFRIPRRATPPAGQDVHITIHDGGKPQYQVTLRSPGPRGGDGAEDGETEFLLPFALPPEHYAAELHSGREHRRVAFMVDGSGEVIVK